jgi:hypothetical protein
MRPGILAAAMAGILALGAEQCQAQGWAFGGPFLYGAGYGLFVYERLPQYSLFPPVYYKHPVPRSYGYSPYAYPPGFATPPVTAASRRVIIVNSYAPQSSSSNEPAQRPPQPVVIHNPYVNDSSARSRRMAQVVGPRASPSETTEPGG